MKRFFTVLVAKSILSSLPAGAAIQGDINNDGRIDTSEAIFALQVAAGLFPGISTSCLLSGKGIWTTLTAYVECDVVTSAGENYICNTSHTSSKIGFGDDIADWDLLSLKGDKGDTGSVGPAGPAVPTVYSSGHAWMDRNLGASRVATSYDDSEAYGDLYQWGRYTDGHEKRTSPSPTPGTPSDGDVPGHGNFIVADSIPFDWRNPQNDNLWQDSGINNPCPAGFRLPTETEWEAERQSWGSDNSAGAFASPLKLVVAGYRYSDGTPYYVDSQGYYWSSTVATLGSRGLAFSSDAILLNYTRAKGFSVRCLKD